MDRKNLDKAIRLADEGGLILTWLYLNKLNNDEDLQNDKVQKTIKQKLNLDTSVYEKEILELLED